MKGINISGLIFFVIIASALVIGSSTFMGDLAVEYNTTIEDKSILNKSVQIQEYADEISAPLNTTEVNAWTGATFFVSAVVNSILLSMGVGDILLGSDGMVVGMSDMLKLPDWAYLLFVAGITIAIAIAVIVALSGRRNV